MKPVHGDTVSNDGYSSTSCSYRIESGRQASRNALLRLFREKYIPFKESKLLEKLVKTRALYEELRNQLLSSSHSNYSNPGFKSGKQHPVITNDTEELEKNNIIALVDLVDKGVILRPKKLNKCHSYNNCNSHLSLGPKENIQRKFPREYLISKSSIISKHKRCCNTGSWLGIQFKTKNIKSDPCTCTSKYREVTEHKSKEVLKSVCREEPKKFNRENNKHKFNKLKRSKPHFIESAKLFNEIQASKKDVEDFKTDVNKHLGKVNRCHAINVKSCCNPNATYKELAPGSAQLENIKKEQRSKLKKSSHSKYNYAYEKKEKCTLGKYKHKVPCGNVQVKKNAAEKSEYHTQTKATKDTFPGSNFYSMPKTPKENNNIVCQETNNRLFNMMTCFLPKISKQSPTLFLSNQANKVDERFIKTDMKQKTSINPDKVITYTKMQNSTSLKVEEKYKAENNCSSSDQNNYFDNLIVNTNTISNVSWLQKDKQENHNLAIKYKDKSPKQISKSCAQKRSIPLEPSFCTSHPMHINNLLKRTPISMATESDKNNTVQPIKIFSSKQKQKQSPSLVCEPFACAVREFLPRKCETESKIPLESHFIGSCRKLRVSNQMSKVLRGIGISSNIQIDFNKQNVLRCMALPSRHNKQYLKNGEVLKYENKSKYTLPKHKLRRYLDSSKLDTKNKVNFLIKPITTYKGNIKFMNRIAGAPKTYLSHKKKLVAFGKGLSITKYVKNSSKCNKTTKDIKNDRLTAQIPKTKEHLSSLVVHENIRFQSLRQRSSYALKTNQKLASNTSSLLRNKHLSNNNKQSCARDNDFYIKSLNTNDAQSLSLKTNRFQKNTQKCKPVQIKKKQCWMISPTPKHRFYALQMHKNNTCKKVIAKRVTFTKCRKNRSKRSEITVKPNELKKPENCMLRTLSKITPLRANYTANTKANTYTNISQKIIPNKTIDLDLHTISHYNRNQTYFDVKSSSSIILVSTSAFNSKRSFCHESEFKFFSSIDQNLKIMSKEVKSEFSCDVNFSKQIVSKTSSKRSSKSKKFVKILERRELRQLANNDTFYPSLQINHQLTGVSSLLRRCFCTMNIQIGARGVPKKTPYKRKDYDCEPGVCAPYECDSHECQKLIMQRLMRQVSKISGTENKSKSILTSSSNQKVKKSGSARLQKRKIVRKKPRGLTYKTLPHQKQSQLPSQPQPHPQLQSHRQATRLGSSFSFDVIFSKNKSSKLSVKETEISPKPQATSTDKATKLDQHLQDKSTHKGAYRQNRKSQFVMKNVYHKASTATPMLNRCFCTLKLQKKGKQQKKREFHTMGTSTPTKMDVEGKHILRTREKGQTTKLKQKTNNGICTPSECSPYECLELIKKRNPRSRGTVSRPNISTSSSMTTFAKSQGRKVYGHTNIRNKSIKLKEVIMRSNPSIISTDKLSSSSTRHGKRFRTRHRKKSVSSSIAASSKTSNAEVTHSAQHMPSYGIIKQLRVAEPSASTVAKEKSSEESTSRQAVKIGSTFSFDIEFYKDQQFPSYRRIQAASEAIKYTKRKMGQAKRNKKTKIDTTSLHSHSSQMYREEKVDKGFNPKLPRCFCTLKLQEKLKKPKHFIQMKQPRDRVKPPKHRGTETPFSRPVADLHDRSVMTVYKLKTFPYKLDPYECEPGVCVPGECDPYECLERIKGRHLDQGSSTENVKTKSALNMTKTGRRHKGNKNQYVSKSNKGEKVRSKVTKLEPKTDSKTIVPSPSGSRQAVKIGSNFSFNVEFYKHRSHSGSTSSPKLETNPVNYEKPKRKNVKYTTSKTSQGISVSTRKRKVQHSKSFSENESQTLSRKMRSTITRVGPFLKRCFCTLKIQKRAQKETKHEKTKIDLENVSVGTETIKYKPEIHSRHRGTLTEKKYKYHGKMLDPNECEPGVCIPGECNPYECLERIKRREMHSKRSGTGRYKGRSVSSSAVSDTKPKPAKIQVAVPKSPKEKKIKTKRTYDRAQTHTGNEYVTHDVGASEQSRRQAVRIGSNFSFNIEFYKDRQVTAAQNNKENDETMKYSKKTVKKTRGGQAKRSRSISSSQTKARIRGHGMQSESMTQSRGSGAGPLLKRCFCTLKLQKIGKEQILSDIQMQTAPTTIETTYKNTGTKIKKRPEIKPIAGREIGTKTKSKRHALEPYECEPGVCIPDECDPYECLERIKNRNTRHSGTGMADTHTKSVSSVTPRAKRTTSMNTQILTRTKRKRATKRYREPQQIRQPPRSSRAIENINIYNRQAVRLGSDFKFNIEFYKDRLKRTSDFEDTAKATIPDCSASVYNERSCSPTKCEASSCTSKCSYKNQGTYDSGERRHKKLQSRRANTESRGSSVRRLKRCFCTLTLQRAEVKNMMNSLRTTTPKVNTQERTTLTKNKYFSQLLPYECEPGVCIPGECDPYECLERIKRRRGPYGPCDCLEKRRAGIRRVSRTTDTGMKRSREIPVRQLISGGLSKKTQAIASPQVNTVVEQPRFKLFHNPYTRNTVRISSNFSFNIEFSRDISFPSSGIESVEYNTDIQNDQTDNMPRIKKYHDTQKPVALKHETTATDLLKRCFCTKQMEAEERSYGSQLLRRCFCSKKSVQVEDDPEEDKIMHDTNIFRRCFCTKKFTKTKQAGKDVMESKGKDKLNKKPLVKCLCSKAQCSCKKAKIKCLCKTKKHDAITVARVEIEGLRPKLQNIQNTEKQIKLLAPENLIKSFYSHTRSNLKFTPPTADKASHKALASKKLLKCFGRHKLLKINSKQSYFKLLTNTQLILNPVKARHVLLKDKSFSEELARSKSIQRRPKDTINKKRNNRIINLYPPNGIHTNFDQSGFIQSPAETKNISSGIKIPERSFSAKCKKSFYRGYNIPTSFHKRRSSSLSNQKQYWVQYQVQHPGLHKRCHGLNKDVKTKSHILQDKDVSHSSASLETIMSYCPKKFHNITTKSTASKDTCCKVCSKLNSKCNCLNKPKYNYINKENIVYTSDKLIVVKHTISVKKIQTPDRKKQSNFKKRTNNCLRLFMSKKNNTSGCKYTTHDKNIKTNMKWGKKSRVCCQNLNELNTLKDKQVQYINKYCDKNVKNMACNIDRKDRNFQYPTVRVCDKVMHSNSQFTKYPISNVTDKITYCSFQNFQCPNNDIDGKNTCLISRHSQCPKVSNHDQAVCKTQLTQSPKLSFLDKITYHKSKHSQCPIANVRYKLTCCNSKNARRVFCDCQTNSLYCKSQTSQCPSARCHEKNTFCQNVPSKSQNTEVKHKRKQKSCNTSIEQKKNVFINNILRHPCIRNKKTKLIKVVKVTSDLKHLICSNNAIYKIKDIVPPGASGDYKFGFVLESKGFKENRKIFINDRSDKEEKCPETGLEDKKISGACFLYKRQEIYSKYDKMSCPCLVCRKIVLPPKCSSDQNISCHMMEVCKIIQPQKTKVRQCCKNRNRWYYLGNIFNCKPKVKTCKCGIKICSKEAKKLTKKEEVIAKLNLTKNNKCVCGSALCAAKFNKKKSKHLRLARKKQEEIINKYKKIDEIHRKKSERRNILKELEVIRDIAMNNNNNSLLIIQSLLDLKDLAKESAKNVVRSGCRVIADPKYAFQQIKHFALHPKAALSESKRKGGPMSSAFKRIGMRLGALTFVRKIKEVLESQASLNYLLHKNNKRRRHRPRPLKLRGCNLYPATLRDKQCFWVYYLWPSFYPHCLHGLRLFKQLTDIMLFTSALVMWSPCLLVTELFRAFMCCLFCMA